jgi:error-prone DNA polymerase
LAGFSPAQGKLLRRALGKKDAQAAIMKFKQQFLDGAAAKSVDTTTALLVFDKLLGIGSYSFPKSHAASFGVMVYQSAWMRLHIPAQYYAPILRNMPMGYYSSSVVMNDAQRHGIRVLPVHIHESKAACQVLDAKTIRLGFQEVRSLGDATIQRLLQARSETPFRNLSDFIQRNRLSERSLEQLILAGALDSFGRSRRELLWDLGKARTVFGLELPDEDGALLPEMDRFERLNMEYDALGLSTEDHIMALLRPQLSERGIYNCEDHKTVKAEAHIQVAGLKVVLQAPPTAKGFRFLSLETEEGFINVIIHPAVYEQYRRTIRQEKLLFVWGKFNRSTGLLISWLRVFAHY